ncbi:bifunctional riboflavin kinase/FAD synthetase [Helicobacter sp. 23-1045]
MKKFSSISKNNKITNITIGKFDSIHLAHQRLISALDKNGAVIIIAFGGDLSDSKSKGANQNAQILPQSEKKRHISTPIYFIKFDKIKNLSGKKFIKLLQKKLPHLREIIVGEDFRFGKNRAFCAKDISKISNLKTRIFKEMKIDKTPVHSQNIRAFLGDGKVAFANKLLGRMHSIKGRIVRGQGLGKKAVVPTINVEVSDYLLPQSAVYASKTRLCGKMHDSITFLGKRESADNNFAIESHILGDFGEETNMLLGKKARIFFVEKIRDNRKFDSLPALKAQIQKDIKKAKAILK